MYGLLCIYNSCTIKSTWLWQLFIHRDAVYFIHFRDGKNNMYNIHRALQMCMTLCMLSLWCLSQVNWETYKKTMKRSMFNATVITLLFQQATYPLVVWRGLDFGVELPSLPTVIWHLFICMVVIEIAFYYSHRCNVLHDILSKKQLLCKTLEYCKNLMNEKCPLRNCVSSFRKRCSNNNSI